MGRPSHAGFALILPRLARDGRNVDEMLATRTFDLATGKLLITRQVLLAVRTFEFEFAHGA